RRARLLAKLNRLAAVGPNERLYLANRFCSGGSRYIRSSSSSSGGISHSFESGWSSLCFEVGFGHSELLSAGSCRFEVCSRFIIESVLTSRPVVNRLRFAALH